MTSETIFARTNFEVYHPADTGSPQQDLCRHLSRLTQFQRLDFERHVLNGETGREVISMIEPDLGAETKETAEARIASPQYAERVLGNATDAAEFVRTLKQIAGEGAPALYLQQAATHYYA